MNIVWTLLLGVIVGVLDILPMIQQKIGRFSIISAFVFHLIMPTLVYANAWDMPLWLKGSFLYILGAVPIMIMVAENDKKSPVIMGISSIILGAAAGLVLSWI